MQVDQLNVTGGTYMHVVKACVNAGEIAEATALLDEMRAGGIHVKKGVAAMVESRAERRNARRSRKESWSPADAARPTQPAGASAPWSEAIPAAAADSPGAPPSPSEHSPSSSAADPPPMPAADTAAARLSERAAALLEARPPRARTLKEFLRAISGHSRSARWSDIMADLDRAIADPDTKVCRRAAVPPLHGHIVGDVTWSAHHYCCRSRVSCAVFLPACVVSFLFDPGNMRAKDDE